MGLGEMTELPTDDRLMEGLGGWWALVKWKSSVLLCSMTRPASIRIFDMML